MQNVGTDGVLKPVFGRFVAVSGNLPGADFGYFFQKSVKFQSWLSAKPTSYEFFDALGGMRLEKPMPPCCSI